MFRASLCPSAGEQDHVLQHGVLHWLCRLWLAVVVWSSRCSSIQLQPAQPVLNTICGSTRSCFPDDGHNDARNMLRLKFDNKHQISCILLVSLSSPYVHDTRSQELKTKLLLIVPTDLLPSLLRKKPPALSL